MRGLDDEVLPMAGGCSIFFDNLDVIFAVKGADLKSLDSKVNALVQVLGAFLCFGVNVLIDQRFDQTWWQKVETSFPSFRNSGARVQKH